MAVGGGVAPKNGAYCINGNDPEASIPIAVREFIFGDRCDPGFHLSKGMEARAATQYEALVQACQLPRNSA